MVWFWHKLIKYVWIGNVRSWKIRLTNFPRSENLSCWPDLILGCSIFVCKNRPRIGKLREICLLLVRLIQTGALLQNRSWTILWSDFFPKQSTTLGSWNPRGCNTYSIQMFLPLCEADSYDMRLLSRQHHVQADIRSGRNTASPPVPIVALLLQMHNLGGCVCAQLSQESRRPKRGSSCGAGRSFRGTPKQVFGWKNTSSKSYNCVYIHDISPSTSVWYGYCVMLAKSWFFFIFGGLPLYISSDQKLCAMRHTTKAGQLQSSGFDV